MAVGRGFLRSYNLVNILYIYLILGGVTIKNNARKHTEGNLAIIFISKELASQKPQYNGNLRKSTNKRKSLTTSTKLLIGMRVFLNFSLVAILIRLSGDVETNPGPFKFEVKECRTRGLKVCHLNVRSLLPKIDKLRLFISKNPFDVIAVSETWLKPSTPNDEIDIPNYSIYRNDRTDKTGGGMAFYVRNGLPFRLRGDLQSSDIETCWIEIIRVGAYCSQANLQVSARAQTHHFGAVWFSPIFIYKCCVDAGHGGNSIQYGQQVNYRCSFH